MPPSAFRSDIRITLGAIAASGALYFFSTGLRGIGPLVFIAPFPILVIAFRSSFGTAFAAALAAYAVGATNMAGYLAGLAPTAVVVSSIFIPAIAFAITVVLARAVALHGVPWLAVIVFPSAWTAYEFLLSGVSPHGTAGSIAYTQTGFLPLLQVVSLTGIWGLTFIVSIIPAGLAVAWHVGDERPRALGALAIPCILVFVVLLFGSIRMLTQRQEWPVQVGLAACDTTVRHFQTTNDTIAIPVVKAYARRAADLATEGAQVVVFPEKFVGVTQRSDTTVLRIFTETARDNRVFIIAGLNDIEPLHNVNTAIVFSPLDNRVLLEYDKRFLVPGLETKYRPGFAQRTFRIRQVNAGIEICKDMDFPSWSREYGKRNTGILFVPAWDFREDGELHARMAIVRGVENGFAVVRCAQEGLLTVSDHTGRVIAEESSSSSPEVLLLSAVSPGPGNTFYVVAGDWFGWLNAAFICVLVPSLVIFVSRRALKQFQAHN